MCHDTLYIQIPLTVHSTETPSSKFQAPNKIQILISKTSNEEYLRSGFWISDIVICLGFGILDLGFLCHAQLDFSIRISPDQSLLGSSPRLFAACYVLHRLLQSRHPPHASSNSSLIALSAISRTHRDLADTSVDNRKSMKTFCRRIS